MNLMFTLCDKSEGKEREVKSCINSMLSLTTHVNSSLVLYSFFVRYYSIHIIIR